MDGTFYQRRVAEKNPTSDNPEMTALVDRIVGWCQIQNGARVLDFGCYDGYILRKLSAHREIIAVGVDIAPAAVALARRLSNETEIEFVVSDGTPLPFATASFDVVVCSEILEHVPDLDGVLKEIARVLAPGGRLFATMPNSLLEVWRPLHPLCRRIDEIEGHLRRMSRAEFLAAVGSHGFAPLRVRYRGFVLTAIWYRNLIYTPRVKALGIRLVAAEKSRVARLARLMAFGAMRAYMLGDRPFSRYRRSLTIEAAFTRLRSEPGAN